MEIYILYNLKAPGNEYRISEQSIFALNKCGIIAAHKMRECNFKCYGSFDCDVRLCFGHLALNAVSQILSPIL